MNLDAVVPPFIDIPYQKADSMARKYNFNRESLKYKIFALGFLFFMLIQVALSVFSVIILKTGAKPLYRYASFKILKECTLVVSCSDENFKETASSLPLNFFWAISWWSMLLSRTWQILLAKSLGKTVVMFPNSVGPFRTSVGKFLAKLALNNCEFVLIREPISFNIVKSLGIHSNIILTADTALLFKSSANYLHNEFSGPRVGVCPGIYGHSLSKKEVDRYIRAHAQALDDCIEKYGLKVFFLPHFVMGFFHDDLQICKQIFARMKNANSAEIIYEPTAEKFKSMLDTMDMVISSKMHPAILAASGYVPVLCIVYDHKQTGFFQNLGMTNCILDIRKLSYKILSCKIDYVWNKRKLLSASLRNQIPQLQENVRLAIKKAIAFSLTDLEQKSND
ncbi:MAG: polysaccharide pyruvyl transferase family protein [Candidatus Jordarchaeaceae archaeon]